MDKRFDVIVVGVGAMGTATCMVLARRGCKVLGLDQSNIPNSLGSSHGHSRIVRLSYYEHSDYVPLLRRAFELWKEIETSTGRTLLHLNGALYIGTRDSELIDGSLRAAREHNLPHSELSHAELWRKFPQFTLPENFVGMMDEMAGWVSPEAAVGAMAARAMHSGAEIHGCEEVISWREGAESVEVTTPNASYHADQLIFCGGPWTSKIVGNLGVDLKVTRQSVSWVWPKLPELFYENRFPTWALALPDESLYYGTPMSDDVPGLKLGHHKRDHVVHPDHFSRTPNLADEASIRPALEKFLPLANGPLLATGICLYTNSPDSHFILDRLPEYRRVSIACGFSGHGFKFAPVIGEIMADLAIREHSDLPIKFLSLNRFQGAANC